MVTVVICSYFEEEHVEHIRAVDERVRVLYREDLVPPPRWLGDHTGPPKWHRSREGEKEFLAMLGEAEVLYDFPRGHVRDLVRVAPRLRWVQASMAGAGAVAQKAGLQDTGVTVTTASGVYSGPLAEFGRKTRRGSTRTNCTRRGISSRRSGRQTAWSSRCPAPRRHFGSWTRRRSRR